MEKVWKKNKGMEEKQRYGRKMFKKGGMMTR